MRISGIRLLTATGGDPTNGGGNKAQEKKTKNTSLILAVCNVWKLLDRDVLERPQRRTALKTNELARCKIDIAALSETRLPGEGELQEKERREAGVGFAVKSSLAGKLVCPPKCMTDRLMTMILPLCCRQKYTTIVSAYAPTMTNRNETKNNFFEDLSSVITAAPRADKLIVLGDFNARAGRDSVSWEGVIGKHGVGNSNSKGLLLLQICAEHGLLITNTIFNLPTSNRTSWMHPRSKHWYHIDYVIIRKRDRQDVRVTKTMCAGQTTDFLYPNSNLEFSPRDDHKLGKHQNA
uniref:Uncharacterized protein n=1 Tax=Octopus bimaculoides TaxID=37653 RepID=A0A0L8G230_OCTBM